MRKILLASAFAVAASTIAVAQDNEKRETIEGNGNLVTHTVDVKSFNELKASGVYELKLTQGTKEEVKIEADENLHDLFTVRNDGDKLVIDMKKMQNKNLKTKHKMRVYVTFKSLKNMELAMVGNVSGENEMAFQDLDLKNSSVGHVELNFTANKLKFENSSVGEVKLRGKAEDAVMRSSGVGSIRAGNFMVQTMNIENTGIGHAEVNAAKTLNVQDSFLGKVKNRGAATARKINQVDL